MDTEWILRGWGETRKKRETAKKQAKHSKQRKDLAFNLRWLRRLGKTFGV